MVFNINVIFYCDFLEVIIKLLNVFVSFVVFNILNLVCDLYMKCNDIYI